MITLMLEDSKVYDNRVLTSQFCKQLCTLYVLLVLFMSQPEANHEIICDTVIVLDDRWPMTMIM